MRELRRGDNSHHSTATQHGPPPLIRKSVLVPRTKSPPQALHIILSALALVMSILNNLVSRAHTEVHQDTPRSLVKVSTARARVLCPSCHGENDEQFRHCQWCGRPRPAAQNRAHSGQSALIINEVALAERSSQFMTDAASQASAKSRSATATQFSNFLASRTAGGAAHIEQTQPQDVVDFFCWLDTSGLRRRTVVHARECEAVGTASLSACSTPSGKACAIRYAHESLRTNHLSTLAGVFEKELGVTEVWSDAQRTGNPVHSQLVDQYMAFTRREQKQAGVLVKQAPTMLRSHLRAIVFPLQLRLQRTDCPLEKLLLARDIALFNVAFSTTKRGDELTRTLIQRILRLPNRSGLMFNFQWGKTLRDGSDHLITVPYEEEEVATCPVMAVEQFVAVGRHAGWDMSQGYLFPTISQRDDVLVRGSGPVSAKQMSAILKKYAKQSGEVQAFSMHSFRSGGAVSRALAGESLGTIMQRAYWKNPKTAWRYMRLMEVVAPGSGGEGMVAGVSEAQYRQFNEFPLSDQSKSWAAFGNQPLL